MARKRRYHPQVADDLSAAVGYYDGIAVDLGNRFRASIRKRLRLITERPDSFGRIHGNMRVTLMDRFPYVILFEDCGEIVAILGIFHAASDQKGWFERSL